LKLLGSVGCDYVFVPTVREMYPSGIVLDVGSQQGTFVEVKGKSHQMEGWIRQHFFRGVATVVCKLFNVVQADKSYFGQKDAQQCVVVRTMVKDLLMPTEIVIGATIREKDGLAMSSRNGYLSKADREAGIVLFKGLKAGHDLFRKQGVNDRKKILALAENVVKGEPRVTLEYFSLAHPETLAEVEQIPAEGAIFSGAIKTTSTRLIDNFLLRHDRDNEIAIL